MELFLKLFFSYHLLVSNGENVNFYDDHTFFAEQVEAGKLGALEASLVVISLVFLAIIMSLFGLVIVKVPNPTVST